MSNRNDAADNQVNNTGDKTKTSLRTKKKFLKEKIGDTESLKIVCIVRK